MLCCEDFKLLCNWSPWFVMLETKRTWGSCRDKVPCTAIVATQTENLILFLFRRVCQWKRFFLEKRRKLPPVNVVLLFCARSRTENCTFYSFPVKDPSPPFRNSPLVALLQRFARQPSPRRPTFSLSLRLRRIGYWFTHFLYTLVLGKNRWAEKTAIRTGKQVRGKMIGTSTNHILSKQK